MYTGLLTASTPATQFGAAAAATQMLGGLLVSMTPSTKELLQENLETLQARGVRAVSKMQWRIKPMAVPNADVHGNEHQLRNPLQPAHAGSMLLQATHALAAAHPATQQLQLRLRYRNRHDDDNTMQSHQSLTRSSGPGLLRTA
jgi:hypothetical protein